MFTTGDEALHPQYGRIVVERIEKIKVGAGTKACLVARVVDLNMTIMVPMDSLEAAGIRKLSSRALMEEVISILQNEDIEQPECNRNGLNRLNMEKITSGDIRKVAEVMKVLSKKSAVKPLSGEDRRLLAHAQRLLVGEIMVSEQISEKKAVQALNGYIHNKESSSMA